MSRVLSHVIPTRSVYMQPANPVDAGWNVAVRHIATKVLPSGWDQVEKFDDAPTTLKGITDYANEHGRLCVAREDSEGTIFDCADTNAHLRAWHDSVHFRHQLAFTVAGEAAAVYVQAAQVYYLYGYSEKTVRWVSYLLADILGLVLHVQKTGKYPKNKRAGVVKYCRKWVRVAHIIGKAVSDNLATHEQVALDLAREAWGNPSE